MHVVELYINNQLVQTTEANKIQLNKVVSDFRNPTKKTGSYSQPFTLPYTAKNKNIFFNEQDKQVLGKFKRTYTAQLTVNGEVLVDGTFTHLKNTGKGFEGAVGATRSTNPTIADILTDKKLVDIKSFAKIAFSGNQTVLDSWSTLVAYPDSEVCFPYVVPCFSHLSTGFRSSYEDLGISHFVPAIVKRLFQDAGYTIEGDIFSSAAFQKLFILYSSTNKQAWNYGQLNPMNAGSPVFGILGGAFTANIIKTIGRSSDTIYVVTYPFQVNTGDLSESLGADGVYTCKCSGLYSWTVRGEHVFQVNGGVVTSTAFTAFRCITDDETIPENSIPGSSQFAGLTTQYLDNGTIAVGGSTDFTFTARLEEGKQYQLQRYISVPNSVVNGRSVFVYANTSGKFNINSVDAPLLVNPALFLPDMLQVDLVNAVFKLFNLFYQVNEAEKIITLFARNDYFQQSLNSVVDLSPYVNILEMEEYPLSDAEIEQTYLAYATDDSDYLLKETNYLELVNGEQPEQATKLPFAPLGFIQVEYNAGTYGNPILGNDLLPAIFPDTASEDTSVLSDEESVSTSSRTPRLALYNGAGWLLDSLESGNTFSTRLHVGLGRLFPSVPNFVGGYNGGGYAYRGFPPKLSFFNLDNQPVYKITVNSALRSFAVTLSTDVTIYSSNNSNFLADVTRKAEMNLTSLAPNVDEARNPKGFFFAEYANDLLIGNLSNYVEGRGRITPTLYNVLTGRQVLRLQNDLFLLDSIKAFDVNSDFATYKLYKLLANTGNATASTIRYTSTQSYTATCTAPASGSPVTKTATRSSYLSQAAADATALAAATAEASLYLVCTVEYTSTKSAVANCPDGYHGSQTTGIGSYTSTISQADADTQAMALAVADAESKLSCEIDDNGGG